MVDKIPTSLLRRLGGICLWLSIGSGLLSGCSFRTQVTIWAASPMLEGVLKAVLMETDLQIACSALESELKLLEGFIELDPNNVELLTTAAQGWTGYALMFAEPEDPQRAAQFYLRANQYGMRALAKRSEVFTDTATTYRQFKAALAKIRVADVPAAYWSATAWGGWVNLNLDDPAAVAESPRALALMNRVIELDEHYYYSGPQWFMGVYYASLPAILGGGFERAAPYFDRALEADGDRFLLGRLLYAEKYAAPLLDRELFHRQLTLILQLAPGVDPQLRLSNSFAAERAKALLDNEQTLFE